MADQKQKPTLGFLINVPSVPVTGLDSFVPGWSRPVQQFPAEDSPSLDPFKTSSAEDAIPPGSEQVVATVYVVSRELGIVKLNAGNRLFAFNIQRMLTDEQSQSLREGQSVRLTVGPRLNKVLKAVPLV